MGNLGNTGEKKELIVFIDSGDTLVDESTEVYNNNDPNHVLSAELFEGAADMLRGLYESGYRIALVADGRTVSFENVYNHYGLYHMFEVKVISQEEGVCKPDSKMFSTAMERMGLTDEDKHRIVMIGNNLKRDVLGANRMGITSILVSLTPRYVMQPETEEEIPAYVASDPRELTELLDFLERQLQNKKILQLEAGHRPRPSSISAST